MLIKVPSSQIAMWRLRGKTKRHIWGWSLDWFNDSSAVPHLAMAEGYHKRHFIILCLFCVSAEQQEPIMTQPQ